MPITRRANHDIAKAYVMLFTRRAASYPNHKSKSDIGKAANHVISDACRREINVVIIFVSIFWFRMRLVKKYICGNALYRYGADPAYSVFFSAKFPFWHDLSLSGRVFGISLSTRHSPLTINLSGIGRCWFIRQCTAAFAFGGNVIAGCAISIH
ncbi:unnamed protein product [Clonostachys solani]|uniref:Uncharacterized protein n=1 Tax=Clonostachys solani TaxID=160281 RepID=A0A9N9ZKX4_9HYPO|nr:unnamed protein product [Clonostachys solani]